MEEYENPDSPATEKQNSSRQQNLDSTISTAYGAPSGIVIPPVNAGGRVEANTALLKIGANAVDVSGFESNPMLDGKSGITPAEDDDGGEAASARIAQEYRRQVRIKRLAEEIQQAEREKKREDDLRRKTDTQLKRSSSIRRKNETAKLDMEQALAAPPDSEETLAKKRAVAMSAFKTAAIGRKSRSGLLTALLALALIGLLACVAWVALNKQAAQRETATTEEATVHALAMAKAEQRAVQDAKEMQAREAELTRKKEAAEDAARKAEGEKKALEEQIRQQDAERQKALNADTARRVAEERRLREENEKLIEQANREKDELRKKIEEAQRTAREKLKQQQDDDAARTANAGGPKTDVAKADVPKPAGTIPEATKPEVTKPEMVKPAAVKNDASLSGDVKTIPSEPAVIPDRLELPSGGVRLFVKASDPYGGKLTFQWRQLKGPQVDIADPAASKFLDGKWISQTYFVAHQPGNYEFEVSVKNDEGVESRKKFPIEVLPPTTLK